MHKYFERTADKLYEYIGKMNYEMIICEIILSVLYIFLPLIFFYGKQSMRTCLYF